MATYTDLLKKYNDYDNNDENTGQCNGWRNVVAPGSCEASKEYKKKMKEFVNNEIEQANKSIVDDEKLLNDRINTEEHKNIYPLLNHDFDYKTAIRKELNPYQLGITNEPSFTNFTKSTFKLSNYARSLLNNPYPNENTIPGITDVVTENDKKKDIISKTQAEDNKLPYPSFRKDYPECLYPTKGEYSTSYFANVGKCSTRITDKDLCLSKGYTWVDEIKPPSYVNNYVSTVDPNKNKNKPPQDAIPPPPEKSKGKCFKPRFVYIDNRPQGLFGIKGAVPSLFSDLLSVTPDKLADIMSGYSLSGSGIVPCAEEFRNNDDNINKISVYLGLGLIMTILYLCYNK
jgi:hypothetical protein